LHQSSTHLSRLASDSFLSGCTKSQLPFGKPLSSSLPFTLDK
jgi:hypothetical protein